VVKIGDIKGRVQIPRVRKRLHPALQEGFHGQVLELRFGQIFGGANRLLCLRQSEITGGDKKEKTAVRTRRRGEMKIK